MFPLFAYSILLVTTFLLENLLVNFARPMQYFLNLCLYLAELTGYFSHLLPTLGI